MNSHTVMGQIVCARLRLIEAEDPKQLEISDVPLTTSQSKLRRP